MFTVEFYEKPNGKSELWDFLENLRSRARNSKDARIQYKQISVYIQLLQEHGTYLPSEITKHVEDDIWELRPGKNRIFYFYFKEKQIVLLHYFRKKTQKTPRGQLERAKKERDDYLLRKKNEKVSQPQQTDEFLRSHL